jgi:hypothetical protein
MIHTATTGGTMNTKSEARVLRAIELLDRVARDEYANHPDEDVRAQTRFLHSLRSIVDGVAVVSTGRKSSDMNISRALDNLVRRGVIERSSVAGLGGGMTLYIDARQAR